MSGRFVIERRWPLSSTGGTWLRSLDVDDRMEAYGLCYNSRPARLEGTQDVPLSDSVGGADASRNGFSNLNPVNVVPSVIGIGLSVRGV